MAHTTPITQYVAHGYVIRHGLWYLEHTHSNWHITNMRTVREVKIKGHGFMCHLELGEKWQIPFYA